MKDAFPCTTDGWDTGAKINITYSTIVDQYGWTCPKCKRVWAPWVRECLECNNPQMKQEKDILE